MEKNEEKSFHFRNCCVVSPLVCKRSRCDWSWSTCDDNVFVRVCFIDKVLKDDFFEEKNIVELKWSLCVLFGGKVRPAAPVNSGMVGKTVKFSVQSGNKSPAPYSKIRTRLVTRQINIIIVMSHQTCRHLNQNFQTHLCRWDSGLVAVYLIWVLVILDVDGMFDRSRSTFVV